MGLLLLNGYTFVPQESISSNYLEERGRKRKVAMKGWEEFFVNNVKFMGK